MRQQSHTVVHDRRRMASVSVPLVFRNIGASVGVTFAFFAGLSLAGRRRSSR